MNVPVTCDGRQCGHAVCVVINPVNKEITHFVARDNKYPHTERLVSLNSVAKTSHDEITLNCTLAQWQQLEPFEEVEFIKVQVPHYETNGLGWPYVSTATYDTVRTPVRELNIPAYSRDVRRGASVYATDGAIGHVEEFVFDAQTHQITHLVLAKGHLWNERDIVIPVSVIKDFDEHRLRLSIDKAAVGNLPTVAVHRHVTALENGLVPL